MVIRVRKKARKTRGFNRKRGSGSKCRGAGNRGGRGRAGLGKRAAHNKLKYLRFPELMRPGKHGFNSIYLKQVKEINVSQLDKQLDSLVENKKALFEKGVYKIDLSQLGFEKLTGSGRVAKKIEVKVKAFSATANKKIESSGGKIINAVETAEE